MKWDEKIIRLWKSVKFFSGLWFGLCRNSTLNMKSKNNFLIQYYYIFVLLTKCKKTEHRSFSCPLDNNLQRCHLHISEDLQCGFDIIFQWKAWNTFMWSPHQWVVAGLSSFYEQSIETFCPLLEFIFKL